MLQKYEIFSTQPRKSAFFFGITNWQIFHFFRFVTLNPEKLSLKKEGNETVTNCNGLSKIHILSSKSVRFYTFFFDRV